MTNLSEQFDLRFEAVPRELTPAELIQAKTWYLAGAASALICVLHGRRPEELLDEALKLTEGTMAEGRFCRAQGDL